MPPAKKTPARYVFRWRNGKNQVVVVVRPYWLSFYANWRSVVWVATMIKGGWLRLARRRLAKHRHCTNYRQVCGVATLLAAAAVDLARLAAELAPFPNPFQTEFFRNLHNWRPSGSNLIQKKKRCDGCGNVAITSMSGASEVDFYCSSAKAMQES
jgi:hypothetical protein